MNFTLDHLHRNVSDDELLADLRQVATNLSKQAVTMKEQETSGRFHPTNLVRRFGRWPFVLERAGLNQTRTQMNISEQELFNNLEELWRKLGRQPRYQEVIKPQSRFSVGTYEKRFGGWRKALEKFVAYVNAEASLENEHSESVYEATLELRQTSRHVNWRLRFLVLRRDNFKCKVCGKSPASDSTVTLQVDHIIPWSKNGPTIIDNLQTLCTMCNIGKSDLF